MNGMTSHIKNSKEFFIRYPNTSKSVKNCLNSAQKEETKFPCEIDAKLGLGTGSDTSS